MKQTLIRKMTLADRLDVADLIYSSTNHWYQTHGRQAIFSGGPSVTEAFFDVYEALDAGCGIVAVNATDSRLIGSCFYHPRETHVSLGIMNSHPNYAGAGVARALLNWIIDFARNEGKPLRLVSSAMNLDSFSLYTRAGFVPRYAYQDMLLPVPKDGLDITVAGLDRVRPAAMADVPAMAELEKRIWGISRQKDYRYFIDNQDGLWHMSVYQGDSGPIEGFCASCGHAGCNMVGPLVAATPAQAEALLATELDRHRGRTPVFLVPVDCSPLVRTAYSWGARNCETHFSQVLGAWQPPSGVAMPTFLPETS